MKRVQKYPLTTGSSKHTVAICCHGRCRAPVCFLFFEFFSVLFDHGVGWSGMLMFMFMLRWRCYIDHGVGWDGNIHLHVFHVSVVQRSSLPRANCSMVEIVFEEWKNRRARLHVQLPWEMHTSPLKKPPTGASQRRSQLVQCIYEPTSMESRKNDDGICCGTSLRHELMHIIHIIHLRNCPLLI